MLHNKCTFMSKSSTMMNYMYACITLKSEPSTSNTE